MFVWLLWSFWGFCPESFFCIFPCWHTRLRICLQCGRPGFDSESRKIPCRRSWQPNPVFLPGESHRQRSLVGYSPWGHKESVITKWLTHTHTHTHHNIYCTFCIAWWVSGMHTSCYRSTCVSVLPSAWKIFLPFSITWLLLFLQVECYLFRRDYSLWLIVHRADLETEILEHK